MCDSENGREIISRNHAEVICDNRNDIYEIHDLGALNGVFVNQIRIDKHILRENDIIQVRNIDFPFSFFLVVVVID